MQVRFEPKLITTIQKGHRWQQNRNIFLIYCSWRKLQYPWNMYKLLLTIPSRDRSIAGSILGMCHLSLNNGSSSGRRATHKRVLPSLLQTEELIINWRLYNFGFKQFMNVFLYHLSFSWIHKMKQYTNRAAIKQIKRVAERKACKRHVCENSTLLISPLCSGARPQGVILLSVLSDLVKIWL